MQSNFTYTQSYSSSGLLRISLPDILATNPTITEVTNVTLIATVSASAATTANFYIMPESSIPANCTTCRYVTQASLTTTAQTFNLNATEIFNTNRDAGKDYIYLRVSPLTNATVSITTIQFNITANHDLATNTVKHRTPTTAYIEMGINTFGKVDANLVDGTVSFSHLDWSFGGGSTEFMLSHIYNSTFENSDQVYTGFPTKAGKGWKTNFHQYLIGSGKNAAYVDAHGKKHTFKQSNGVLYDNGGLGLTLTSAGACKKVTDELGNTMHFSKDGYLCKVDTIFKNSIFISHNDAGDIESIQIGDNIASFNYSNNLLDNITYTGINEKLQFTYNSNSQLIKISKKINTNESVQAQFDYDTNGRLKKVYGNDYTHLKIDYDTTNKVTKLSNCSDATNAELASTQIEYAANAAFATTERGVRYKYSIKNNGDLVKIEEVIGNSYFEIYPDKNKNNRAITNTYVGTLILDNVATANITGYNSISFGPANNKNTLTIEDIRASLQTLAKKNNGYFDFFYNGRKDRICNIPVSNCSLSDGSTTVNYSSTMLSEKTIVNDISGANLYEIVSAETFDYNGVKTTVSNKSKSLNKSVRTEEYYTLYNGNVTYSIDYNAGQDKYIKTTYTYDGYDNETGTSAQHYGSTTHASEKGITRTSSSYSPNGEYMTSSTDERGRTTSYENSMPHNIPTKITLPTLISKNFSYDLFKEQFTSISCSFNSQTIKNDFTYLKNHLTSVKNDFTTYTFGYNNESGELETVSTPNATLLNNTYNYSTNIGTKRYHNDSASSAEQTTYDKYGNISTISYNGKTASFTYKDNGHSYNSKANLVEVIDGFAGTTTTYPITDNETLQFSVTDTQNGGKLDWSKTNRTSGNNSIITYNIGNDSTTYTQEQYDSNGNISNRITISPPESYMRDKFECYYTKDLSGRIISKSCLLPYVNYTASTSNGYTHTFEDGKYPVVTGEENTYTHRNVKTTTNREYSYDNYGNITKVVYKENNVPYTTHYHYDALKRLIREDNEKLNSTVVYTYDNGGNITKKQIRTYTEQRDVTNFNSTINYSYDNSWKDLLTSYNGQSIIYNNGYPTSYRGMSLSWNRNMLSQVTKNNVTYTYTYDVNGRKVKSQIGSGLTCYFFYEGDKLIAEHRYSSLMPNVAYIKIEYLYDETGVCGCKIFHKGTNNEQFRYYQVTKDVVGNVVRLDGEEGCVMKVDYDAFGVPHYATDVESMAVGNGVYLADYYFALAYKGYYYDYAIGMYYLITRYYDPEVGRFISPDTIDYIEPQALCGLNLFAYCKNNPVMNYDPSGHFALSAILISGLVSAAISGVFNVIEQSTSGKQFDFADFALDVTLGFAGGAIGTAIPATGFVKTGLVNGIISLTSDTISGDVTSFSKAAFSFTIGTLSGIGGKFIEKYRIFNKTSKLMQLSSKKQSATINSMLMKKKPILKGLGHNKLGNWSTNIFKGYSFDETKNILNLIYEKSTVAYSSFVSSIFSSGAKYSTSI